MQREVMPVPVMFESAHPDSRVIAHDHFDVSSHRDIVGEVCVILFTNQMSQISAHICVRLTVLEGTVHT